MVLIFNKLFNKWSLFDLFSYFKTKKYNILLALTILFYFTFQNYYINVRFNKCSYFNEAMDFEVRSKSLCPNSNNMNKLNVSIWTLLTDYKGYSDSAVKLIRSIKSNTCYDLNDFFVMEIRENPLPGEIRKKLEDAGWRIKTVNRIPPRDETAAIGRFKDQFTKLELWNIDQYEANIYFDSDTLVIGNIDEFLNLHKNFKNDRHKIGVSRDIRMGNWVKTFNMGVFIIKPNKTEFKNLLNLKNDFNLKFEGEMAEQGFLNEVYKNQWYEIGFENNANLAFFSQKPDYWWARSNEINVIHFTIEKPWECGGVYKKICELWESF